MPSGGFRRDKAQPPDQQQRAFRQGLGQTDDRAGQMPGAQGAALVDTDAFWIAPYPNARHGTGAARFKDARGRK